ncbi:MAG: phosphoribosylaminoimidazolesuccinocarboxamide synthase [Tissierellia bacterium]|nr:phosphoribosylaminoimidazolesuccinocarboxamide synthase [Tissierellia bacterium]
MELINKGKTKDVYELENGNYLLVFKDDVTGTNGVFDPGANTVGLTMEGAGQAGLRLTKFFFETFKKWQIPTHYVSANLEENTMEVLKAKPFGSGLECICRFKAVGSFLKRYGKYCEEGQNLDALVEITIKDDEAGDPLITEDALVMLGITTSEEYSELVRLTREISEGIAKILREEEMELYDIKLEFGKDAEGKIMLIDEISGGNMRVYRGDEKIMPLDLPGLLIG